MVWTPNGTTYQRSLPLESDLLGVFDLYPKQLTKQVSNLHAAITMFRMKDLNVSIFNNISLGRKDIGSIGFTLSETHIFEPENRPKPKIKVVIIPTIHFQVLH